MPCLALTPAAPCALQAQALASAKELLVYKLSDKMETYFPMLLEFQLSHEAVVKQTVVEAVLDCVGAVPRLDFLTAATGCVRHMLNDAFPSVVKAALVAAKNLVALSLHALCYAKAHERENAEAQWRALGGVLETVTGPRLTSHKNQAVRMLTVKLLELITLMTSASHCPSVKGASHLSLSLWTLSATEQDWLCAVRRGCR